VAIKIVKGPNGKPKLVIPASEIRRDVMRAGGPGGQHQNKTESAVRLTHEPTGVSAESRSDRSQHANEAIALERLEEKILGLWLISQGVSAKESWRLRPRASFGNQMRTYNLCGQARVVDHETGWQGNPRSVLDGDLDELLQVRVRERALQPAAP